MKYWITALFITLTFLACKKDEMGCVDEMLSNNNLTPYTGQDIGCNTYLYLTKLDETEYFYFGSHCIDFVILPFNCAGDTICQMESFECSYYFNNKVDEGIVGFIE